MTIICLFGKFSNDTEPSQYDISYCNWEGTYKELEEHLKKCPIYKRMEETTKLQLLTEFHEQHKQALEESTTNATGLSMVDLSVDKTPYTVGGEVKPQNTIHAVSSNPNEKEGTESADVVWLRVIFQEKEESVSLPKNKIKISHLQKVVREAFAIDGIQPHQLTFEVKDADGYKEKLNKYMLSSINHKTDIVYATVSTKIRVILNIGKKRHKLILKK